MQINVAWEVLGDAAKRREYDIIYHPQVNARPNTSEPSTTPQSSWQPPRPSTTTYNDARSQAESQKKRSEWLSWEWQQEQSIRRCQKDVNILETEIAALNAKILENRAKLTSDVPYWWNVLASLSQRLSEEEKNGIRRQNLDSEAAIRIKQPRLDREQSRLQQLKEELSRRREQENARLQAEQREKERRERLAREQAAAEARRRYEEQQRVAREAREKAEAESRRRYEEQQRSAREAREKAAREEAARREAAEAARRKKLAEERAARDAAFKRTQEEVARKARAATVERERREKRAKKQNQKAAKQQTTTKMTCEHKVYWKKVMGHYECAHCTRSLFRFAYQCPRCSTIACAACMKTLKAGGTPTTYYEEPRGSAHSSRAKGKGPHVPLSTWYDAYDEHDYTETWGHSYDTYGSDPSPPPSPPLSPWDDDRWAYYD